ncbi:MAG: HyaD/HybD family hydrogenase maturation endopeptidase [Thiohalocapsa sp.]|uniref:HyaD/HybD family hydrogenase maturation endopeptidase n=1 Tax=Thiohalocapsa sp. TaxID=2497641 RepID=UPI0025D19176|nr:HyaD/HybD family hydrogenase maturation endopeptidase [Thiohalocapsa sp.]MCG6941938.1 HyaD/HybD family hydrogenase maturation endopeptidase [Thiohalocapsa sp.]
MLVLGIGNILWADEGFGVRCVEAMAARYRFGDNVTLLDGGTQGIYLVDQVRAADVLVVFDAVDYGLAPGTLKRVEGDAVPKFLGAKKMSLHQTGFQEVLTLADLLGGYPDHVLLIGVQPEALEDFGGSLRPVVKAQIEPAIDLALGYLTDLGIAPPAASEPRDAGGERPHPALDLAAYEAGRPAPEDACRIGDARVLPRLTAAGDSH